MTLFRRQNGIYYFKFEQDGRIRWKSTGCRTKSEAMAMIKGLKSSTQERASRMTAVDFIGQILDYTVSNYASRTHEIYELSLRRLHECFPHLEFDKLTLRHADKYKIWRLEEVTQTTLNIELRTLRSAFNLARRWGIINENPFAGVQLYRIPDSPPSYLTFMQWDMLDACIRGKWLEDIIIFAICTGMRQGEILHLEWRHVDLERRVVHVTSTATFKTKAGKRRVVPLNEKAIATLTGRPQGCERVFMYEGLPIRRDSLTKAFKRLVREAGLPEAIHFHSLRHTFASWLVQDGVSLFQVGRLLGHTNTRTTEIYAHLQPETMHDVVDRIRF